MKKHSFSLRLSDKAVLATVSTYIQDHPDADLSIRSLAKRFGVNYDKLKKGFLCQYGITLHHYVILIRIETASKLLMSTDQPIKKISSLVGYKTRNLYFLFKKYKKISPNKYRNQFHRN